MEFHQAFGVVQLHLQNNVRYASSFNYVQLQNTQKASTFSSLLIISHLYCTAVQSPLGVEAPMPKKSFHSLPHSFMC